MRLRAGLRYQELGQGLIKENDMSDYINKNTFKISTSKHDAEWDKKVDEFKINDPDSPMVIPDCNINHWKWNDTKNIVEEMTQDEKNSVDQALIDGQTQAEENAKDIDNLQKGIRSWLS